MKVKLSGQETVCTLERALVFYEDTIRISHTKIPGCSGLIHVFKQIFTKGL